MYAYFLDLGLLFSIRTSSETPFDDIFFSTLESETFGIASNLGCSSVLVFR
jgi:hypothetical protein